MNEGWEPRIRMGALHFGLAGGHGGHSLLRVHHLYLWNSAGQPTGIDLKRLISGLAGGVM